MIKYKLHAVASILAASSILVSNPVSSTSRLPEISAEPNSSSSQYCPVGQPFGCFTLSTQRSTVGLNRSTASSRGSFQSPFLSCMQFMQRFMPWGKS